jgi:peptidyl-prolyl cis-trans isomerase A (cyclophilin A)
MKGMTPRTNGSLWASKIAPLLIALIAVSWDSRRAGAQGTEKEPDGHESRAERTPASAKGPRPDPAKTYAVAIDGDPVVGKSDARVTLVMGYDYACFFSHQVRATLDELRKKYGKELRIVYKPYLVHTSQAMAPALAACAAHKQKRFEKMDALLWEKGFAAKSYDEHKCWLTDAGCPIALGLGKELKLDVAKMKADMKSCEGEVHADHAALLAHGMGGTPGFFINGRWLAGSVPVEQFTALIDEELKKAGERASTPRAKYYQKWVVESGAKAPEVTPPSRYELARYLDEVPGTGDLHAEIETSMGTFHCALYPDRAPLTVANFIGLATGKKAWKLRGKTQLGKPFYDGLTFHRVLPGFMIQGGDPMGNGTGGAGYPFDNETDKTPGHKAGALAMANAGANTNSSQFYILEVPRPELDQGFTVFGRCKETELVAKIAAVPRDARDKPVTPVTIVGIKFVRQVGN